MRSLLDASPWISQYQLQRIVGRVVRGRVAKPTKADSAVINTLRTDGPTPSPCGN